MITTASLVAGTMLPPLGNRKSSNLKSTKTSFTSFQDGMSTTSSQPMDLTLMGECADGTDVPTLSVITKKLRKLTPLSFGLKK